MRTHPTPPRFPLLALLVAVGCVEGRARPGDGGQFGEESGAACKPQTETPLAWDEVSAAGLTAQELADLVAAEFTAPLTWADATSTALSVAATAPANPRFVDYEWEDDGSGIEPAMTCVDVVAIDVALAVTTDDGALAESVAVTLESAVATDVTAWIDLDAPSGSFRAADWADGDYDDVWADLELSFGGAGISGAIHGYGEKTEGSGPDGMVSLTMFDIATF